jgi:predicted O-methyltransferase YrrM
VNQRKVVDARLLELQGGDPFEYVIRAAEAHRAAHGPVCGLYPAGPHVMRLVATLVRSTSAKHILDIGTGFGYSALWLATAAGPGARIEAIDQFADHVAAAQRFAELAGVAERVRFHVGDAGELLGQLVGPYDLVHDDAWFAAEPTYFDRVVELLKPGGVLTMPNWFLLTDAMAGKRHRRWARFAGSDWEAATQAYARRLANDRRIHVTWTVSPPLGIAVKQAEAGGG